MFHLEDQSMRNFKTIFVLAGAALLSLSACDKKNSNPSAPADVLTTSVPNPNFPNLAIKFDIENSAFKRESKIAVEQNPTDHIGSKIINLGSPARTQFFQAKGDCNSQQVHFFTTLVRNGSPSCAIRVVMNEKAIETAKIEVEKIFDAFSSNSQAERPNFAVAKLYLQTSLEADCTLYETATPIATQRYRKSYVYRKYAPGHGTESPAIIITASSGRELVLFSGHQFSFDFPSNRWIGNDGRIAQLKAQDGPYIMCVQPDTSQPKLVFTTWINTDFKFTPAVHYLESEQLIDSQK